jgi:acetyl esterase/lipase
VEPGASAGVWLRMGSRRRWPLRVGVIVGAVAIAAVALAPSWRNYYLRRGGVRIVEDVAYVPEPADATHRLDLYLPETGVGPWPVVVFVHGGFWRPFDRRMFQAFTGLHGCVGVALANRSVATVVLGYRQRPEAPSLQEALDDVGRAIRYVSDNIGAEGGDPKRLYVVGHSAGALFTALLAADPRHLARAGVSPGRVRGFAMLSGPYDLARLISHAAADLAGKIRASASDDDIERFSPERHVRPGHPPTLFLVGGDEEAFMVAEQRSMAAALRQAGGDVTAVELPGVSHMGLVMDLSRPGNAALPAMLRFIDNHR